MTPKSDHEEDMSMEEILSSIRKFVTDNPAEDPNQKQVYRSDSAEAVAITHVGQKKSSEDTSSGFSAAGLSMFQEPIAQGSSPEHNPKVSQQSHLEREELSHASPVNHRSSNHDSQPESSGGDADILELNSPIASSGPIPNQHSAWTPPSRTSLHKKSLEESIMTLTNPIDSKKVEPPSRVPPRASQLAELEETLSSSQAAAASASSLSRLAQASKTALKRTPTLADQRGVTLDQLIQDLIRPMIKQWIDTHLPTLVEEMVAKEIKRITKHLG